ncbi:tyrosine recombinase XerA [soil metagenome]
MKISPELRAGPSLPGDIKFDTAILAGTRSPNAIAQYAHYFRQYLAYATSFAQALDPATLIRWRSDLVNTPYITKAGPHHYSVNAINVRLSAIRSMMYEAANQGYISPSLAQAFGEIEGIKAGAMQDRCNPNARVPLTPAQMRTICDAPDLNSLAGTMHRAFLSTLAGSGLRVSEAVTLMTSQIEWGIDKQQRAGFAVLVTNKTSTQLEPRPLSLEAYLRIQQWLNARTVSSSYIFTGFSGRGDRGPLTTSIRPVSAWEMVRRYARQVGIEHVKPHDFRRFVATQLAEFDSGLVQKALGHKRLAPALNAYAQDELARGITDNLY